MPTCHWCHVMKRESFEDHDVAQILNEHFVAVKVDREETPTWTMFICRCARRLPGRAAGR